jgi:hypothetical protein
VPQVTLLGPILLSGTRDLLKKQAAVPGAI